MMMNFALPEHVDTKRGFTLIEILVVVLLVSIISTAAFSAFQSNRAQARDAERQTELRNIEIAIETYRREHRRYPSGSNGTNTWSGQSGSDFSSGNCPGSVEGAIGAYICGLVPQYIDDLPADRYAPTRGGYIYFTNEEQTAYKLVSHNTIESGSVTMTSCPAHCEAAGYTLCVDAERSIAVWGGQDDDVLCAMPPPQ